MWKCFPFDYRRYVGAAFCKNASFCIAKQAVLRRETSRFETRNGAWGNVKQVIYQQEFIKTYGLQSEYGKKNEGVGCTFGRKLFLSPASPAYYDSTFIFLSFRCIDCFSRI